MISAMETTQTFHLWANFEGVLHYWTSNGWRRPGTDGKLITFTDRHRACEAIGEACQVSAGPKMPMPMEVDLSTEHLVWPPGTVAR